MGRYEAAGSIRGGRIYEAAVRCAAALWRRPGHAAGDAGPLLDLVSHHRWNKQQRVIGYQIREEPPRVGAPVANTLVAAGQRPQITLGAHIV